MKMYNNDSAPEFVIQACSCLRLHANACQMLSKDHLICLVTEDWLKNLSHGTILPLLENQLNDCTLERLLSRSCKKVPRPWCKISIKIFPKSDVLFKGIPSNQSKKQWSCGSLYEFMSHICEENTSNLWVEAHKVLKGKSNSHGKDEEAVSFTTLIKQLIQKLQPAVYIDLQSHPYDNIKLDDLLSSSNKLLNVQSSEAKTSAAARSRPGSFYTTEESALSHGLLKSHAIVESEQHFFFIQPYIPYTLKDVVAFSPSILETSHAKPLFIIYQLLQAMQSLHNLGLRMGNANISNILLDENMWLRVSIPRMGTFKAVLPQQGDMESSMMNKSISPDVSAGKDALPQGLTLLSSQWALGSPYSVNERYFQIACEFLKTEQYKTFEISMLDSVVSAWVHRQITNFQYLMILNHLAGRRMDDPNNHPVLPWVMDFSSVESGYRDLSKSKFRINKGDGQLDFTYTGMLSLDDAGDHVPHHISDILSDITYYVYKARRTPKSVLCAHVRTIWVPHEYPHSMQRMQHWTPDECIPEFFTDPSIFESIHDDLPDLAIPPWSKNALDFVVRHLGALESDQVSANLHRWIDLTFGLKLSGVAAVKAKNVHLHLMDQHTHLTSYGVTQLFQHRHPSRDPSSSTSQKLPRIIRGVVSSQLSTYGFPDPEFESQFGGEIGTEGSDPFKINQAAIYLPKTYNPMAELERCEKLLQFNTKALHTPSSVLASSSLVPDNSSGDQVESTEEMVTFLCLVCEMFLDAKLRMQDSKPSLMQRVKTIKAICSPNYSEIQRPLQKFVSEMFGCLEINANKTFTFSTIFSDGSPLPTPSFLLQTYSDFIPFPQYFTDLFSCLSSIEGKTSEIEGLRASRLSAAEKVNKIKQLEREKVPLLESFLWRHQGYLGVEGMGLVLPYIKNLLHNHYTSVQAAWALFGAAARELGQIESTKQFLPELTPLYSGEDATAKHIKLYHRSFLMQLIVRLGLKTFLVNFSTLLIEAVAGYKDFPLSTKFYNEELLEDLKEDDFLKSTSTNSVRMTWPGSYSDSVTGDDMDGTEDNIQFDGDKDSDEDSEEIDETIVDRMSLNGEHVSLENDEDNNHNEERHSLSSGSSIDPIEHQVIQKQKHTLQLEEDAGEGKYGSADQHSIHSISMLIPPSENDRLSSQVSAGDIEPAELENVEKEGYLSSFITLERARKISTDVKPEKIKEDNYENEERDTVNSLSSYSNNNAYDDLDSSNGWERARDKSDMVRSETEDLMMNLSSDTPGGTININDIAADSVKWLTHKLGPVLATKYLSRNLVRMLALCYLGGEQLQLVENPVSEECDIKTSRLVVGDRNAQKILECIAFTVMLYGEQVILIQCLPNIMDMITMGEKRLTARSESGLIASVILLSFLLPYLSDTFLMNVLEENIIDGCITPVLSIIVSSTICFPSGALSRFVLCHKFLDLLYTLGLRLGFEMTRKYLNKTMLRLFDVISTVHGDPSDKEKNSVSPTPSMQEVGSSGSDDTFLDIKIDALTQQYKIGSPVDLRSLKSPKNKLHKIHSLSYIAINDDKEDYVDSRSSTSTAEKCMHELKSVFTPELTQACYIPICRIFGSIHMEENLKNDDLIRQLCAQHDANMDIKYPNGQQPNTEAGKNVNQGYDDDLMSPMEESKVVGAIGSNIAVVGNRIQLNESSSASPASASPSLSQFGRGYRHSGILSIRVEDLRSAEMDQNKSRHLSGNWLAYWERELGRHERDTMFNFLQIELQTYTGHTSSIRSLCTMDTENCFVSASKDKTVRLWSISSCGDGMKKLPSLFCYGRHKKSVFSVAYVDSMRQVASCDSTVHVWDPYTGMAISQLESPKYAPVVALSALPAPSTLVATATTENTLRFLDIRTSKYTHGFKASLGNCGLMRCVLVSPDSSWVAVGFTSGFIFILDVRSGILLHHWKAHDAEILQLKAYSKSRILSSAFDQTIKLWNVDTGQEVCATKTQSEPVHCLSLYREQLITASTANRVSVYAGVTETTAFSSSKLKTGTFKGVLTHMSVLPLNKALLLGADNGTIRLMA